MQRITKIAAFFAAVVGASALGAPAETAAQVAPPITIDKTNVKYEGDGCPPGSVTLLEMSSDAKGQVLPIKLNEFESFVTPSSTHMTLNCKLDLTLNVPAGWVAAVSSFSYFGFADLEAGVTGTFNANYIWRGSPVPARSNDIKSISGPQSNVPFTWKDLVTTPSWSRCAAQEKLTLNSSLTVVNSKNPARNGSVKLDRTDVDVTSTMLIAFDVRRCP